MITDRNTIKRYYRFLPQVQADHIQTIMRLSPGSKAFVQPLSSGMAVADGAGTFITEINGWGLGEAPVTDQEIDDTLALYEAVGFSPQIELSTFADLTLFRRLEDRGFRLQTWIVASGRPVREGDQTPMLPEGIVFRKTREDECEAWSKLVALGFEDLDGGDVDENTLDIGRGVFHHPHTVTFTAEIDGIPAGASAIVINDGVGYMASASTLPKYRNRGIQGGMMSIRIAEAAKAGVPEVLHQTSLGSASHRNALRSGMESLFVSAYLK